MSVAPVVRYMIVCDDWGINAADETRIDIHGLVTYIVAAGALPYPVTLSGLCLILVLAELRGSGFGHVRCVFEQTGELIFETPNFDVRGTSDVLDVLVFPIRIVECAFPRRGIYSVQFWYNEAIVHEIPLHVRDQP